MELLYFCSKSGYYTLQVRATDELGRWSEETTEIKDECDQKVHSSFFLTIQRHVNITKASLNACIRKRI